jgi:hypothetical protein
MAWAEKNNDDSNKGCCNNTLFLLLCADSKINSKEVEEKEAVLSGCLGVLIPLHGARTHWCSGSWNACAIEQTVVVQQDLVEIMTAMMHSALCVQQATFTACGAFVQNASFVSLICHIYAHCHSFKFSMLRLGWSGQTGETDRLR